ncbi:glycosyltransferase family 2 protein [Aequorivita aquimaris]|uniref:glycosyltransferase family 2 protein n=1 Tax=Aequorivita aquimaris TaxID=1548749 RepID=UPI000786FB52|nr:glycosyltransferase [Aequorivita aquimaris]
MSKKVTVSVIMITYNQAAYIEEAINGIIIQDCDFNVELIIANDYSPDKTDEIVKELLLRLIIPPNIKLKYINHNVNKLPNPNYLWALGEAQGKYIANCEGDDYWTDPSKLQKQVDFLENNPEYAACFTNIDLLRDGQIYPAVLKEKHKQNFDAKTILDGFWIPTLTVIFRAESLPKPLPKQFHKVANGDVFLFHILAQAGKIGYLDFVSGVYRQHTEGVWTGSNLIDQINKRIMTLELLKDYFKVELGMVKVFDNHIMNNRRRMVEYYWKNRKMRLLINEYIRFSKEYPLDSYRLLFSNIMKKILKIYNTNN